MTLTLATMIWENATVAALVGALAGLIATLLCTAIIERIRLGRLTNAVVVESEEPHGNFGRLRVCNKGVYPMRQCIGYISIRHERDDVLPRRQHPQVAVARESVIALEDQQLCWSVASPEPNPMKVDIYPGERQPMAVYKFESGAIWIPSENWAGGDRARALLSPKSYRATLRILSMDTWPREFEIEFGEAVHGKVRILSVPNHELWRRLLRWSGIKF